MRLTMKRILSLALALFAASSFAATLNPVSLINPAGSVSGQPIISTGPTTPPTWGVVRASAGGTGLSVNLGAGNMLVGTGTSTMSGINSATAGYLLTANGVGNAPSFQSPASLGLGCSSGCTFTGQTSLTNTTAGASVLKLTGDGSTTPSKFVGVFGGNFTIFNSAGGSQILGLSDAGTLTVANIAGTTAGGNAAVGSVGEYVTASGGPANITSATSTSVGLVSLPAGDWDVQVVASFSSTGTSMTQTYLGVSTALNSLGALGTYTETQLGSTAPAALQVMTSPVVRLNLTAASTLVYATGNAAFSTGTCAMSSVIRARRVR